MQIDSEHGLVRVEVIVGSKDAHSTRDTHGAQKKIRIGPLYPFCPALVEETCRGFKVRRVERQVRESSKLLLQSEELRFFPDTREQLLADRAYDGELELGNEPRQFCNSRLFARGFALTQRQRPN